MSAKLTKKAHSEALTEVRKTLSADLRTQLQAVGALPDHQINTDDVPEAQECSGAAGQILPSQQAVFDASY